MSDEVEYEPIPGLPHALPAGEHLIWQGRPEWRALARTAFHVPLLAGYFALFIVARGLFTLSDGQGIGGALLAMVTVLPLALACLGLLSLLAWLNARATVYTITSRRVVMRFGVALPMTFNLPFKRLGAADLKLRKQRDGDIVLSLSGTGRIAYLHLWPHARPWRFAPAQPMLRAISDAARVASLLGDAVQAWSQAEQVMVTAPDAPAPVAADDVGAPVHLHHQVAPAGA